MTPEHLRSLFLWDIETGRIFWRHLYKGREAFVSVQNKGYLYGKVYGRNYLAHRVLWALETGAWPEGEIDHINQNRADNRMKNLRVVSHTQNGRNKRRYKNNSSGALGVSKTSTGRWRAFITVNRKQIHIGVFDTVEAAAHARREAGERYAFSPRHGTL